MSKGLRGPGRRRSPANRVGFRPGDLILGVNRYEIEDVAGLARELRRPARSWRIDFSRDGRVRHVEVNL